MKRKIGHVLAVAVAVAGLAFGAAGAAYADGNPYPALPVQNYVTGLCVDSNWMYGQTGTTPAYVTECNSGHVNQGWYSAPAGGGVDEVQIYNSWSGCLQALPTARSVVVAHCDSGNIDQMWVVYRQGATGSTAGIWSYDSNACGYDCYLGDDQGLGLDANSGLHPSAYELWSPPQSG